MSKAKRPQGHAQNINLYCYQNYLPYCKNNIEVLSLLLLISYLCFDAHFYFDG
ncbi:MAG: hypothetical protein NZ455_01980 [Bacteroidia bacterium]|nr:hypothetical protein [Bacteroidia bacterium]MDW8345634.1 hypothetical protein [Bacteroidia bacterium]